MRNLDPLTNRYTTWTESHEFVYYKLKHCHIGQNFKKDDMKLKSIRPNVIWDWCFSPSFMISGSKITTVEGHHNSFPACCQRNYLTEFTINNCFLYFIIINLGDHFTDFWSLLNVPRSSLLWMAAEGVKISLYLIFQTKFSSFNKIEQIHLVLNFFYATIVILGKSIILELS